ncbi:MAG: PD-(D/E)XK nuclease family protein [Acidobacteriia bacterium]|nr:PD-(D/E)XK nuclease family protein [Terriglobia bacterium]
MIKFLHERQRVHIDDDRGARNLLRGGLIRGFAGFVDGWVRDLPQVPDATLYLLVEEAARRTNRAEFVRAAHLGGFCASLARTILEFSSAGCGSARLARHLPDAPLAAAFTAVYREVERAVEERGLALRAARLERAAERIGREGLGGVRTVWLHGFDTFTEPEQRVIDALARQAKVMVSQGPSVHTNGDRPRGRPGRSAHATFCAPSVERECEEIARRILEEAAAGRPFHEIGIIVRAAEAYIPLLRSTLGRFGIPAHFHFDAPLDRQPAVRFLSGVVEAMLGGWDHAQTLAALRLAPRFADSMVMDRFDFAVREQIPEAGLGSLKALLVAPDGHPLSTGAERVMRKIDRIGSIEEWRLFNLSPADWAEQLRELRALFRPARPADGIGHERALELRRQSAALDEFDAALDEAAQALAPRRQIRLEEFWRAAKSVLRLKGLRAPDRRGNVVHAVGAREARHWTFPVVFVCGVTERQFPRFHAQDPFFPEPARRELNAAGIRVATAAEFEREERALFDSAVACASALVTLSYPEFDSRGERNLESVFLEEYGGARRHANIRIAPGEACLAPTRGGHVGAGHARPGVQIMAPPLLEVLRERTARVSPTSLESYLKCPFQYFARRTLRLAAPPARPEKRLDFLLQGSIVHETLAEWYVRRQEDIAIVFQRTFARAMENHHVPDGYRRQALRHAMLEDLRAFAAGDPWPREGFESRVEQPFAYSLGESVRVSGVIDRLDLAPGGDAYVIDYKYSGRRGAKDRLEDETLLQAPLYFIAAEKQFGVRPAGMFYVGLKSGVVYAGWKEASSGPDLPAGLPIPADWLARAAERATQAVDEIRAGRAEPRPDPEICRLCDYGDVCRRSAAARRPAVEAEGA